MSQLEEGEAAEDFDDFGFYFPPITDAELKSRRIWNVSLRPREKLVSRIGRRHGRMLHEPGRISRLRSRGG
jgi:hypothetical protein